MENGDGTGILLLCSTIVGLPAVLILTTALVPGYVKRAQGVMHKWPGRSFLMGLVNLVFFFAIALLANVNFAPVKLIGALSLFIIMPSLLTIGLLIAVAVTGDRLWQQITSKPAALIGAVVLGIPLVGLTLLVPILGWIIFLGVVCAGLGASIIALFQRKQAQVEDKVE
ncbi:MAG: hypothetical protein AB8I69_10195 [Anaerolineae bacterium]|jgi:hypothetical protein